MKRLLIGCTFILFLCSVAVAGLVHFGISRISNWHSNRNARIETQRVIRENGITQRRQYFESHLSQETRSTIPNVFYTYAGFRDWWRMPLVFPYQLMCIDTRNRAYLETYDPAHPVANPNISTKQLFGDIIRLATDNRFLVFERRVGATTSYGMLRYESGEQKTFSEEDELWKAAIDAGYANEQILLSVEKLFSIYYDWENNFVE